MFKFPAISKWHNHRVGFSGLLAIILFLPLFLNVPCALGTRVAKSQGDANTAKELKASRECCERRNNVPQD